MMIMTMTMMMTMMKMTVVIVAAEAVWGPLLQLVRVARTTPHTDL